MEDVCGRNMWRRRLEPCLFEQFATIQYSAHFHPKPSYICNSGRELGPRRARPANYWFTEFKFNKAWLAKT
jgi:hypothetical protein